MAITGGTVSFEQSRKLAEYENRKAVVTFNVTDEDGADAEVHKALGIAQSYVLQALGLTKAQPEPQTETKAAAKPRGRPAKAKDDPKPAISTGEERVDPADVTNGGDTTDETSLDDVLGLTGDEEPVTDKDLTEAVARKNAELITGLGPAGTKKIKDLLAKYGIIAPKRVPDIPDVSRHEFLRDLGGLKT